MNKLEQEAYDTLFHFKWPNGFRCPSCNYAEFYTIQTRRHPLYQCKSCRHQTSLQAGTMMEGSRTPLHKWATAIQLVSRVETGTSAVQLQAAIQVTYKTAWLILHRIRQAMSQAEQSAPLGGTVKSIMRHYTRPYYSVYNDKLLKSPVIIAAQVDDTNTPLHVKFKQIPQDQLVGTTRVRQHGVDIFIRQHVQRDADFHPVAVPYNHKKTPLICDEYHASRRWIIHTFHYIGPKYIQAYLNEYAFKRNLTLRQEPILTRLLAACTHYSRLPLDYYAPRNEYRNNTIHPGLIQKLRTA